MAFFEPKGKLFGVSSVGVGMKVVKFKYASYFFIVLTILMFALFLHKVGGFFFLISNMDNKTLVVQGTAMYRNIFFYIRDAVYRLLHNLLVIEKN